MADLPTTRLTTVSCAGPDDRTDPAALISLCAEWPVVEIGVQASRSRQGSREYPSRGWIEAFAGAALRSRAAGVPVRAALHVNGGWCRDLRSGVMPIEVAGMLAFRDASGPVFPRVQMNFRIGRDEACLDAVYRAVRVLNGLGHSVILQSNSHNARFLAALADRDLPFDVLHDASEGLGRRPAEWPTAWAARFNAWAGGISPETAACDVAAVEPLARDRWLAAFGIDAQSGLRTPGSGLDFEPSRAAALVSAACARGTRCAARMPVP